MAETGKFIRFSPIVLWAGYPTLNWIFSTRNTKI